MTDFSVDELLWERGMSDEGSENYWADVAQARARDMNAVTVPGRALLRQYLPAVEEGLKAFLKKTEGRAGRHHEGAPYLRLMPPKKVALLALVAVIDGMYGLTPTVALARKIGKALEDECRVTEVRKKDPAFWKDVNERTAHLGPQRRRRWVLRRSKTLNLLPPVWRTKARVATGLVCISLIEEHTRLIESKNLVVGPDKTQLHTAPTAEVVDWVAGADERAASAAVRYRPTIEPPLDWVDAWDGGYRTDFVLRRPVARFRGKGHEALVKARDPDTYRVALNGINALQRVPWRVNSDVLEVASHLLETGGAPLDSLVRLPIPPSLGPDATEEEWQARNLVARGTHAANTVRDAHRLLIGHTCRIARRMGAAPFYMPHRMCFRGRVYPVPPWLQPQGPDVARALLRFAEPDPMTPEGWDALMGWGAELGADADAARAVYSDPLEHASHWSALKDPWQALAWYLEVGAALEAGYPHRPFLTSLPCFVDASNNGLQLYSLLTGCRDLAKWTNVLPGDKNDLYTRVGDLAWRSVTAAAETPGHWAQAYALDLVRVLGQSGIPRDCSKRPVMCMPYNVTPWSAASYVREWYQEQYTTFEDVIGPLEHNQKSTRYLARELMQAVRVACPAAVEGMRWLGELSDVCTGKGVPLRWTAPSGWPVVQEYRVQKARRISVHLGGSVRRLTIYDEGGRADPERQRRSAAPNFVHSVDASIMSAAVGGWEGPIAAVHDAFGSTAPRMPALHKRLRESVVAVCVENSPFDVIRDEVQAYIGVEVPDPPRYGTIEAGEVLASTHLFG